MAGFCFVFGIAVLAEKLRWPNLWPEILWLVVASLFVTAVAWRLSRRRRMGRRDAVALLDQRLEAGGLLMTLSELPSPAWTSRLPQLESLWQEALPRPRPNRFAWILVLPVTFAFATCFVLLREIHEPIVMGAVSQQVTLHNPGR